MKQPCAPKDMNSVRFLATVVAALVATWTPLPAASSSRLPFKPSAAEMSMLPEYCAARLGEDAALQKQWSQEMGREIFQHLHHFCFGLNYVNRLRFHPTSKHRKHYAQTAVAQFNYVLSRWPEDYALTIEARNYKLQLELQLSQMKR